MKTEIIKRPLAEYIVNYLSDLLRGLGLEGDTLNLVRTFDFVYCSWHCDTCIMVGHEKNSD